jgi:hypothetical protein
LEVFIFSPLLGSISQKPSYFQWGEQPMLGSWQGKEDPALTSALRQQFIAPMPLFSLAFHSAVAPIFCRMRFHFQIQPTAAAGWQLG